MPRRELSKPSQIVEWLEDWGRRLDEPGAMVLIGSGGLLWHAAEVGIDAALPEQSMDVYPITSDGAVAELAYDSIIGSDFEREHGWHVNLMPDMALRGLPEGWQVRAKTAAYGKLSVTVPAVADLLVPKLQRGEPRDRAHSLWAIELGLVPKPA